VTQPAWVLMTQQPAGLPLSRPPFLCPLASGPRTAPPLVTLPLFAKPFWTETGTGKGAMIEKGTERKVMTIEREIEIEIEIGTGVGIEIESESESETGIERGRERGVGIGKKEIEITIGQAERGETMTEIGTVRGEAGVQGQIHMKDTGRAHLRERRTCQVICKS
jgi:hypothetical protein